MILRQWRHFEACIALVSVVPLVNAEYDWTVNPHHQLPDTQQGCSAALRTYPLALRGPQLLQVHQLRDAAGQQRALAVPHAAAHPAAHAAHLLDLHARTCACMPAFMQPMLPAHSSQGACMHAGPVSSN